MNKNIAIGYGLALAIGFGVVTCAEADSWFFAEIQQGVASNQGN